MTATAETNRALIANTLGFTTMLSIRDPHGTAERCAGWLFDAGLLDGIASPNEAESVLHEHMTMAEAESVVRYLRDHAYLFPLNVV